MKKRLLSLILAALFIVVAAAGCSASSSKNAADKATGAYYEYSGADAAPEPESKEDYDSYDDGVDMLSADSDISATAGLETTVQPGRLVILNADVNLETTDFQKSIDSLEAAIAELGGYVAGSSTNVYNSTYSLRNASYTVRIPADKFNQFVALQSSVGNVNYCNVWQDDVTSSYRDIETRLSTLRTKHERLLSMLEEADIMTDIIEIENALSDTLYQIESLEGSLRSYDDQIAYSTITVNITQVRVISEPDELPKTLGDRIALQFKNALKNTGEFFEDFIVFLVGALPVLVILGVIAVIVLVILRLTRARRLEKRAERRLRSEQAAAEWRARRDSSIPSAVFKAEKKTEDDKENK